MEKFLKEVVEYRKDLESSKFLKSLKLVENEIKTAIRKGNLQVTIHHIITNKQHSKQIVKILNLHGYTCRYSNFLIFGTLEVSWEKY